MRPDKSPQSSYHGRMCLKRSLYRALFLCLVGATSCWAATARSDSDSTRAERALIEAKLAFEPNLGQAPAGVDFVARGLGYNLALSPGSLRLSLGGGRSPLEMTIVGADPKAAPFSKQPQSRSSSYFIGADTDRWVRGAPVYSRAGFRGVYPGIDVVYYTRDGLLEYDFQVAAGGDPDFIEVDFGPDRALIDANGELVVQTASGEMRQQRPIAYQLINNQRIEVASSFEKRPQGAIGFRLGDYDRAAALVIDPSVGLATYLGGSADDRINGIRITAEGDIWVVGTTSSVDFPLPPRGFPAELGGETDIFVTRLERSLDAQGDPTWGITSTVFIGGSAGDRGVAVDFVEGKKIVILGDTDSPDYPVTEGAWQTAPGGGADAYITILRESDFPFFPLGVQQRAPSNYEIEYSTLVGGVADDVTLDGFVGGFAEGAPCVGFVGLTDSDNFPTNGVSLQRGKSGGADSFFSFFCMDDSAPARYSQTYGTMLGGNGSELRTAVALANNGTFCLAVQTPTNDLQANGAQPTSGGEDDIYVTCQEPVRRSFGTPFVYQELGSTYFGGVIDEALGGVAIIEGAAGGFGVITALTSESLDIPQPSGIAPLPDGALDDNPGLNSVVIVGLNSSLSQIRTQFWIGGRADERVGHISARDDCLALAGTTQSADLLLSGGFPQEQHAGLDDLLISKMCFDSELAATMEYSGFFGSAAGEFGVHVELGPGGNEFAAGLFSLSALGEARQAAPSFPTSASAPQPGFGGGVRDGFIVEFFRPRLRPEAVLGAADFRSRPIAPGQILSLFVASIGPDQALGATFDEFGRLPTSVGPTRVLFDGVPAPMLFSALNQTSVIAPFFLDDRTEVNVEVEVSGVRSLPVRLAVEPTAPAVFTLNQRGNGQGAILNQDFTVNGPTAPAAAGSVVQIFLTGGGQTARPGVDGEIVAARQPFPVLLAPVTVTIGGLVADVQFQGAAPGLVHGVVQINARISAEHPPDQASSLDIQIGGRSIQPGVTLAVQ